MAPQTHTRYRVQRLIRMGEWLERNAPAMVTAFDAIDEAHDLLMEADEDMSHSEVIEMAYGKMMQPVKSLCLTMMELRRDDWGVKRGTDVTLHHPFAADEHKYEVVMEAPKPNLPVILTDEDK